AHHGAWADIATTAPAPALMKSRRPSFEYVMVTLPQDRFASPPRTGGVAAHQEDIAKLLCRRRRCGHSGLTTRPAFQRMPSAIIFDGRPPRLSWEGTTLPEDYVFQFQTDPLSFSFLR